MGVVVFNPTSFKQAFPEFATVSDDALVLDFGLACSMLNNTDVSIVRDLTLRATLLNLLTAHFAFLLQGANGQAPTQLVGRISSAGEGSVNVSTEYAGATNNQAFFIQTKYGAMYWQMTAPFRLGGFFIPPPAPPVVFVPQG